MLKGYLKHFKESFVSKIIILILIILELNNIITHDQFILFALIDILLVDDLIAAFRSALCQTIIESVEEIERENSI